MEGTHKVFLWLLIIIRYLLNITVKYNIYIYLFDPGNLSGLISDLVNTASQIQSDIEHMQGMACVSHTVTNGSASPLSCQM